MHGPHAIGSTMSPKPLHHHLDKLRSQLMLTSRRVNKTIGVLQDAQAQARVRLEELSTANVDEVREGAGLMCDEEWRLVVAVDKVSLLAKSSLEAMSAMQQAFGALVPRLAACTNEIRSHIASLAHLIKRMKMDPPASYAAVCDEPSPRIRAAKGTPKSSANSVDLFAMQASAHAASILDAEALAACNKVLEAVRDHTGKLEGAASDRALRMQEVLTSPTRKSPAERKRAGEIGVEALIEALCEAAKLKEGESSHDAPLHLLRGSYPQPEAPEVHRTHTLCNSYPHADLELGGPKAVYKLKKREAAAAKLAASSILELKQREAAVQQANDLRVFSRSFAWFGGASRKAENAKPKSIAFSC